MRVWIMGVGLGVVLAGSVGCTPHDKRACAGGIEGCRCAASDRCHDGSACYEGRCVAPEYVARLAEFARQEEEERRQREAVARASAPQVMPPIRASSWSRVRQRKPIIRGKIDHDIVRRVIRAHLNEIRYCYDRGRLRVHTLRGTPKVQFFIGADGRAHGGKFLRRSFPDRAVGTCMAEAVNRWKFPRPSNGKDVRVVQQFQLSPP